MFIPYSLLGLYSLKKVKGKSVFFCSVRFFVNHAFLFSARRADQKKTRGAFFFCSVRGGGKFTHSLAHPGARFFLFCARQGEIHSLTGASGGAFFFLFCARRGKFTHSLARVVFFCCLRGGGNSLTHSHVRGRVFFFAVCAAVDIHSLTGASGGDSLTHWRVRGRVFFFAPCAAGEIHSLTGASAAVCGWNRGRVLFLLRARRGKSWVCV